jgi:hypothetical protein
VHLTPTAPPLNQVERFFALFAERMIRRSVYCSVAALRHDIKAFIAAHNAEPQPFRWTKGADDTLASIERLCCRLRPAKTVITRTSGSAL